LLDDVAFEKHENLGENPAAKCRNKVRHLASARRASHLPQVLPKIVSSKAHNL